MKHQTSALSVADGAQLFSQSWVPDEPARGTIIVAHGYAEHSGRYTHVAEYFVHQGYAVYSFDQRGHGQSSRSDRGYFDRFETLCDDLRRYVEWVRTQERMGPLFLVGHSMGGMLSLYYAIRHQAMLKGMVLSGPYLAREQDEPALVRAFLRLLSRIAPKTGVRLIDSSTISKDLAVVQAYESDPNNYRGQILARAAAEWFAVTPYIIGNLQRITLPILILHGEADRLVSPACSQLIYDRIGSPDKSLKFYDGLYHEIFNEPEKARVLADVWVWLASHQSTSELRAAGLARQK
jgi:acylglycerol lipase